MAVDLSDAVIDLESARSAARDAILSALDARPGRKALVMDPSFAPTLTSLCTMSELTEHGVDGLYQLEGGSVETECDEIVFMVKPRVALMAALNETVRGVILDNELDRAEHREQHGDDPALWDPRSETYDPDVPPPPRVPNMTVCFAPASTDACEGELRRLGVHDLLIRRECAVDLVPLEPDVFVADCDEAWRDLTLEGDVSCVKQCARALHALQRRCGWATVVKGKGTAAKEIAEAMERMRREAFASDPALNPSLFPGNGHASDYDSSSESDENDDPNDDPNDDDDDDDGGRRRRVRDDKGRERDRRGRRFRPAHPGVEDPPPPPAPAIDVLLIIDRDVDPVTPLCTQLTYEGFVDEAVGIVNGAVEVTGDDGSSTRVRLNSNDALFRELRDLNFGRACDALKEKTSSMQREYETIKGGKVQDQTVGEIGGFVKKLGEKQGLELHSNLAKRCLEMTRGGAGASADDNSAFMRGLEVERMCVEGRDLDKILEHLRNLVHTSGDDPRRAARLLALASLTHGGIPAAKLEPVRLDMLRAYGSRILTVFGAMEQCGWLATREDKSAHARAFPAIRKPLALVVDDVDDHDPSDVAYAFSHSGYAPASCRLIHHALAGSFRLIDDVLRALPGPHFEYTQGFDPNDGSPAVTAVDARVFQRRRERAVGTAGGLGLDQHNPNPKPPRRGPGRRPTCVVFFVGGVTRAEISCLRFMSSDKMRMGVDFVVGATSVCGGFDLVEQVMGPDVAAYFPSLDRGGSTRVGGGAAANGHGAAANGHAAGDESGDNVEDAPASSAFDAFVASFPKWM